MSSISLRLITLVAAFCMYGQLSAAQSYGPPLRVLNVAKPQNYNPDHDSNQPDVAVKYSGHVNGTLWARVFFDTPDNLRKIVANTPKGTKECLEFHNFWPIEISLGEDGLLLDEVFKRYVGDSRADATYAIVFEEGDEQAEEMFTFKMTRADAEAYFKRALPLNIHPSSDEKARRQQAQRNAATWAHTAGVASAAAPQPPPGALTSPPCRTFRSLLRADEAPSAKPQREWLALLLHPSQREHLKELAVRDAPASVPLNAATCGE